jgi:C4-dicarboxylate transporter DctM subunit
MEAILLLGLTLFTAVLFITGVPIMLVFAFWGMGFAALINPALFRNMPIVAYRSLDTFALAAVPIFIAVGGLINRLGFGGDIIQFSKSVVGWTPGSVGNTALLTSGIFSAITGSNTATTAAVGEALHDEMEEEKYEPRFAAATIAAGGVLGVIIPPSTMFILYGALFGKSITELFLGGFIPGLFMLGGLLSVCTYESVSKGYGMDKVPISPRNVVQTAWETKHVFITIGLLLGGIYAGLFVPSESGAIGMLYIILAGVMTGAVSSVKKLLQAFQFTIAIIGAIQPVYVVAIIIQQNLSFLGLEQVVSGAILSLGWDPLIILAMISILLLTGSLFASVPNLVLTAPLLAPVAAELGYSPIMWGVIFIISDSIGFITPPYGLNLYIISSLTGLDYIDIALASLKYLVVLILIWVFFIVFPGANFLIA